MRAGLRVETYTFIEGIIRNYKTYPRWISQRKEEIIAPHKQIDENIGGGRGGSISNTTERAVTALVLDKSLMSLQREYEAVDLAFNTCEEKTKEIIELYYLQRPRTKTWDGVAQEVGYSKKQCQRLRDGFVKFIAEQIGLT